MNYRSKAPTIVDVAREAGVSKSTISRVLNGSDRVLPETEAKVFSAMDHLGYQINQMARALRTRKSRLVGVVLPSLNEVYAVQAEGVDAILRPHGELSVVSSFGWTVEACVDTIATLCGRGIDGLIVGLPDDTDPRMVRAVIESPVPMVLLDREVMGSAHDAVLTDEAPGMSHAIAHLALVGRSKIGMIAMTLKTRPGRATLSAYTAALNDEGLEYRPDLVVQTNTFDRVSGFRAAARLVASGVDALIVATPMASLAGVIGYLSNLNMSYPRDISLVGFHEHELSMAKRPRLSVITRDVRGIGELAGELMLTRLANLEGPPVIRTVPTWFVTGESSDPAHQSQ